MTRLFFSTFLAGNGFVLSLIFAPASAGAAPGGLDGSFAGTGKARFGFGGGYDLGHAVAVQADGKLVMAGSSEPSSGSGNPLFALVRFDTNNVLDASFGQGGKVLTAVNSRGLPSWTSAAANAVQIQADGRIIAAGFAYNGGTNSEFTLARYNPDGSLDTTFGTNGTGKVYTDFGQASVINAMAIQGDGRIVAAGYVSSGSYGNYQPDGFALARYQTNGILDPSFGAGGTVTTPAANTYTAANGLLILGGDKILAFGTGIGSGHGGIDFAVFRYTTNGALDTTFGGGSGTVFTAITTNSSGFNYYDSANSAAIQAGNNTILNPDKLVLAGYYWNMGYPADYFEFALARYNLDGTLDTSFGNGGIVTNAIGAGTGNFWGDHGQAVVVQGFSFHPRLITVGGYGSDGTSNYFALARYTASGALDATFGPNGTGKVTMPFSRGVDAAALAMAFQAGKLVLAGYTGVSGHNYDFTAARFNSDGSPDTNFGAAGVVTADVSALDSTAQAIAIQSDGRIVVAGGANNSTNTVFALARCNADGSLDTSFGSGGKVTTLFGFNDRQSDQANAVGIQPDGKLVAAGLSYDGTNNFFAVARYNTNGTPDTSFGLGGKATTLVGSGGPAKAVGIQHDGRILVGGYTAIGQYNTFALARFNSNGTLDTSFGGIGSVTTGFAHVPSVDQAYALGIQPDGRIILAGFTEYVSGGSVAADFALVRYLTNGAVDFSFGSLGRATASFGAGTVNFGNAVALQRDGKIVVAGAAQIPPDSYVALARFNTNGTLDASFGNNGAVVTEVGFSMDSATSLALQPDGRIVVAGSSQQGTNYEYMVLRYNPDGSLDGSYGIGGGVLVTFGDGGDDNGYAIALDPIGRAVVAGSANGLFGVVRLTGEPFLKFLSVARLGNGHAQLTGLGVPNSGNTLYGSTNLSRANFGALGSVIPDASGFWQYDDSGAADLTRRFYRLSFP